jgi:nitrite reductase/ring-hydroxylating ferredoxin subunit
MSDASRSTPAADVDLLSDADRLIVELQRHPDGTVGERVTRLLENIDAVHRAGLTHLLNAIKAMAGDAFVNRLVADPAVRILLMSYDLVAVDRRLMAEEAIDLVRGHLHAHGVDVEVHEVVGGVVYVRLHGVSPGEPKFGSAVADVEGTLKEAFIGFQELVTRERHTTSPALPTIQIGALRRPRAPVYKDVMASDLLINGTLAPVLVDGTPLLLARVDGHVYAVNDACGDSPLPLRFSRLEGHVLHCSFHGCRYDVRTGRRLDAHGEIDRIAVFPVKETRGRILLAVGVEPLTAGGS